MIKDFLRRIVLYVVQKYTSDDTKYIMVQDVFDCFVVKVKDFDLRFMFTSKDYTIPNFMLTKRRAWAFEEMEFVSCYVEKMGGCDT